MSLGSVLYFYFSSCSGPTAYTCSWELNASTMCSAGGVGVVDRTTCSQMKMVQYRYQVNDAEE